MLPSAFATPEAALIRLRALQLSAERAVECLERLQRLAKILSLFEHFFPAEFSHYRFRFIGDPEGQHRAILRFFTLITQSFFPLPDHIYDFEEDLESYLGGITVLPLVSDWWNDGIEDLSTAQLAALGLIHGGEYAGEGLGPFAAAAKIGREYVTDWERLQTLCREAPEPLNHLWDAITAIDHSAGNPFIDSSYEMPWEENWSVESLEMLTAAYQEAVEMLKRVDALDAWIREDPSRVGLIVELWNKAARKRDEEES